MDAKETFQAEIKTNFNDENAWDDRRNLFDIYLAETFDNNKHYIVYLDTKETDFDKAVSDLKSQYKRLTS